MNLNRRCFRLSFCQPKFWMWSKLHLIQSPPALYFLNIYRICAAFSFSPFFFCICPLHVIVFKNEQISVRIEIEWDDDYSKLRRRKHKQFLLDMSATVNLYTLFSWRLVPNLQRCWFVSCFVYKTLCFGWQQVSCCENCDLFECSGEEQLNRIVM